MTKSMKSTQNVNNTESSSLSQTQVLTKNIHVYVSIMCTTSVKEGGDLKE